MLAAAATFLLQASPPATHIGLTEVVCDTCDLFLITATHPHANGFLLRWTVLTAAFIFLVRGGRLLPCRRQVVWTVLLPCADPSRIFARRLWFGWFLVSSKSHSQCPPYVPCLGPFCFCRASAALRLLRPALSMGLASFIVGALRPGGPL